MHRLGLAAAAVTFLIFAACSAALAAMPASPSGFAAARARTGLIVQVTTVCGRNGCGQIFTKRVVHPPQGFVSRAAPLVFPGTNGRPLPQSQSQSK